MGQSGGVLRLSHLNAKRFEIVETTKTNQITGTIFILDEDLFVNNIIKGLLTRKQLKEKRKVK